MYACMYVCMYVCMHACMYFIVLQYVSSNLRIGFNHSVEMILSKGMKKKKIIIPSINDTRICLLSSNPIKRLI